MLKLIDLQAADVEAAVKELTLTTIEADGWLAKADQAVACVEAFCTDQVSKNHEFCIKNKEILY